jgi:hypothetical protein
VSGGAEIDELGAPPIGKAGRALEAHPRIVGRCDERARKAEMPCGQHIRQFELIGIGRRDQQGADDAVTVIVGGLHGCEHAEAVGDDQKRAGLARDFAAYAARPFGQIGAFPIALDHADGIGELLFEPCLPVGRAARVQTWNDESGGHS